MHSYLDEILHNNDDVKLKVIFISRNNNLDPGSFIVSLFLAISEENKHNLKDVLDDWYLNSHKEYTSFLAKYPIKNKLLEQRFKLDIMNQWCDLAEVSHTPTLFVNGFRLPENYTVRELKHIL